MRQGFLDKQYRILLCLLCRPELCGVPRHEREVLRDGRVLSAPRGQPGRRGQDQIGTGEGNPNCMGG